MSPKLSDLLPNPWDRLARSSNVVARARTNFDLNRRFAMENFVERRFAQRPFRGISDSFGKFRNLS